MFRLIIFKLLSSLVSCSYAISQSDQILIANHNAHHLAFHQPDLGIHHQLSFHQSANHQPNLFQNSPAHLPPRLANQPHPMRTSRLVPAASSPKSTIIHTRPQDQNRQAQFNQNANSFKPVSRPPQSRSATNGKRQKQSPAQRNHGHHHHQSKINWGRCPMLQPSIEEKMKKAQVISKCLEITPVPENITRETIELHRELVAACALREEGWFTQTSALSSDETSSKISVNNSNNKMLLNTNLTTTSIDQVNETLTTNEENSLKSDDQTKETSKNAKNRTTTDITTASESLLQPVHLNANETKIDQSTDENTLTTNSTSKTDKLDDQTPSVQHESKHSALESDDYMEEDLSGYSAIFTGQLTYNYAKAEHEIRNKHFDPDVEEKVIQYHDSCKEEAQDKYNNPIQIIGQIQLYQACK